jgi:hypothetical protein
MSGDEKRKEKHDENIYDMNEHRPVDIRDDESKQVSTCCVQEGKHCDED